MYIQVSQAQQKSGSQEDKKHWSDVYYEQLDENLVWIKESYDLVVSKLPKTVRYKYK